MKNKRHMGLAIMIALKNKGNEMNDNQDMAPPEGGEEKVEALTGMESANTIYLADDAYPEAQDGDTVSTMVEGTLMMHEGKKYLHVISADGKPVQDMEMGGEEEGQDVDDMEESMAKYSIKNNGLKSYM